MNISGLKSFAINNLNKIDPSKLADLSPAGQRLAIGATALIVQPQVDWYSNSNVDDKTRNYSKVKTYVKVIIGTATGVTARYLGGLLGKYLVEKGKLSVPQGIDSNKYIMGVSAVFAVATTVLTTFALDIPLMNKALNSIMSKFYPDMAVKNKK